MNRSDQIARIENLLREALRPSELSVTDESHKHEGHQEWKDGILTHVHIKVASSLLEGRPRLEQHRAVMAVLAPVIKEGLHSARLTIISCKSL